MDANIIPTVLSIIAIIMSLVTLVRTRKLYENATVQSHIDLKYKTLELAVDQRTRIFDYTLRIKNLENTFGSVNTHELSKLKLQLENLSNNSINVTQGLSNKESQKMNGIDELEMRETYGVYLQQNSVLNSVQQLIEMHEKA